MSRSREQEVTTRHPAAAILQVEEVTLRMLRPETVTVTRKRRGRLEEKEKKSPGVKGESRCV